MKIAKTEAAKAALKDLLDDDAQAAAGGNALISRREALDDVLRLETSEALAV